MSLQKGGTLDPDMYIERTPWEDKGSGQDDTGPPQGTSRMPATGAGMGGRHRTGPSCCPQKEPRLAPWLWGDGIFLLFQLSSLGCSAMELLGEGEQLNLRRELGEVMVVLSRLFSSLHPWLIVSSECVGPENHWLPCWRGMQFRTTQDWEKKTVVILVTTMKRLPMSVILRARVGNNRKLATIWQESQEVRQVTMVSLDEPKCNWWL